MGPLVARLKIEGNAENLAMGLETVLTHLQAWSTYPVNNETVAAVTEAAALIERAQDLIRQAKITVKK